LLVCVAGYILTSVGRVHQLYAVLEVLRPAIVTGLGAIALYLMDQRGARRLGLLRVPTTRYVLLLLVWMTLSLPGSIFRGNSFELLTDSFIKTVLMYLVVAGAVRGARDVERLAFVYYLAAAVYAWVVLTRFDLGGGNAWRLGRLYYYDANDFATFAVTAIPLGLYFAHAGRRLITKAFAVAALVVLALAFVRSGSRGGFLSLVCVGIFIVFRYSAIAFRWRLSAFTLVAAVLVVTASGEYWRQMGTILSDTDYNHTEESGRLQIWKRGLGYMLQSPVFGVGADNFETAEGTLSPLAIRQQFGRGVRWTAAHNSYIQIGAELGFPGLLFFLAALASGFTALVGPQRSAGGEGGLPDRTSALRQALVSSLIGFVVGAFFLSLAYHEIAYTLMALAVGLRKVVDPPMPRRVRST